LLDECMILIEDHLPWKNINTTSGEANFQSVCQRIIDKANDTSKPLFKFDSKHFESRFYYEHTSKVAEHFKGAPAIAWKQTNANGKITLIDLTKIFVDTLNRVDLIYKDTMGIADGITHRVNELVELGYLERNAPPNMQRAAVILSNILMSCEWVGLPTTLEYFNGLYIKYLKKANIIRLINHREKKYCITHAGCPPILSYPLGFGSGKIAGNSKEIIKKINKEKDELMNNFKQNNLSYGNLPYGKTNIWKIKNDTKPIDYRENLAKFVQLSAHTGSSQNEGIEYGSYYSPIVANPMNNFTNLLNNRGGHSTWTNIKENIEFVTYEQIAEEFDYEIFGHQPQGMYPQVVDSKNKYHICLDVSMINRQNFLTTGTFAYMYVADDNSSICGRIVLPKDTKYTIQYNIEETNIHKQDYCVPIDSFKKNINNILNISDNKLDSIWASQEHPLELMGRKVDKFVFTNSFRPILYFK